MKRRRAKTRAMMAKSCGPGSAALPSPRRRGDVSWLSGFGRPPGQVHVVHGEPAAAESLAETLRTERGWNAETARDGAIVHLAG